MLGPGLPHRRRRVVLRVALHLPTRRRLEAPPRARRRGHRRGEPLHEGAEHGHHSRPRFNGRVNRRRLPRAKAARPNRRDASSLPSLLVVVIVLFLLVITRLMEPTFYAPISRQVIFLYSCSFLILATKPLNTHSTYYPERLKVKFERHVHSAICLSHDFAVVVVIVVVSSRQRSRQPASGRERELCRHRRAIHRWSSLGRRRFENTGSSRRRTPSTTSRIRHAQYRVPMASFCISCADHVTRKTSLEQRLPARGIVSRIVPVRRETRKGSEIPTYVLSPDQRAVTLLPRGTIFGTVVRARRGRFARHRQR